MSRGKSDDEEKTFTPSEGITSDKAAELNLADCPPIATLLNFVYVAILLVILFINAAILFYETTKEGNPVAVLSASLKPMATVKRDGCWLCIDAAELVPGDLVCLSVGSAVPADCYVNEGEIEVDQSAMTGESLPVKFFRGDMCKMGCSVIRGEVEGTVGTTGQNTFLGKTAAMIQNMESAGGSASFLQVMLVFVVLSLTLCTMAFIHLSTVLNNQNNLLPAVQQKPYSNIAKESLSFVAVVLISSIPLALEIVTTTTLAAGSQTLSAHGAVVARLASIEAMAGMDMLCADQTGSLTLNSMVIQDECPTWAAAEGKETVLFQAALASKWTEPPRDAVDTMVLRTGLHLPQGWGGAEDAQGEETMRRLNEYEQLEWTRFDPRTGKAEAKLRGPDGEVFRIARGSPDAILSMCEDKDKVRPRVDKEVNALRSRGLGCLAVGRMDEADGRWRLLGILTFLDPPRHDTQAAIEDARKLGVEVKMFTGDSKNVASGTARLLGMKGQIQGPEGLPVLLEGGGVPGRLSDNYGALVVPPCGFAQVSSEHKYLIVETLRRVGYRCGVAAGAVADTPALRRADVGIAVEVCSRAGEWTGGSASPSDVPTREPCEEWPLYFQLPVPMIMLVTLLNDGALMSIGYDARTVQASRTPERLKVGSMFAMATVLGSAGCAASLLLLAAGLDSHNPTGIFAGLGLPPIEYGKVVTSLYLQVSVTGFLTLFSARTQDKFFFTALPSPILFGAAFGSLALSTLLSSFWPAGQLDGLPVMGLALGGHTLFPLWIWIYCIIWWLIQDCLKVATFRVWAGLKVFEPLAVDRDKWVELSRKQPQDQDD